VIGTKNTVTPAPLAGVEHVFRPDGQMECVREADYVVVAAAATRETRRMVDAATLRAMKPTATLINVARGDLIDEPALLDALTSRRLRAAYLDVFVTEPLSADSPFYDLDNVVVTPHNAAWSPHVVGQAVAIFLDNYRRYAVGLPLINVVDKRRGY
jgi:phosphoglycerate dehydrogenase-like enzyme